MRHMKIKIGEKYGKLTTMEIVGRRKQGNSGGFYIRCKCDCGKEVVVRSDLIGGHTKSCGCLKKELLVENTFLPNILPDKKIPKNNTSGHIGVVQSRGKWYAKIQIQKKRIHLGTYDTYEEACLAREVAEKVLFQPILDQYSYPKEKEESQKKSA